MLTNPTSFLTANLLIEKNGVWAIVHFTYKFKKANKIFFGKKSAGPLGIYQNTVSAKNQHDGSSRKVRTV